MAAAPAPTLNQILHAGMFAGNPAAQALLDAAGNLRDPDALARRNSKQLHKLSRRIRYGKSLGALVNAGIANLSNADRATLLGSQLQTRIADGYYGRGLYRRRTLRRRRMPYRPLKRRRMYGRGGYSFNDFRKSVAKKAGFVARNRGALTTAAGLAGAALGGPEGEMLGTSLMGDAADVAAILAGKHGRGMYTGVLGSGSYNIEGNSLVEGLGSSIPTFASPGNEDGSTILRHQEYVGDVYAQEYDGDKPVRPMDYNIFELNPGLARSFPFASQTANNFEEYSFIQCIYTFKSKIADNISSSDGQLGSIIMYVEYNPNDKMMTSKQRILQTYSQTNAKITDMAIHGVECDKDKILGDGEKFTRANPVTTSTDMIQYDWGKILIGVTGTPKILANQVIGELWVSYTLVFRKPRVHTLYGFGLNKDIYTIDDPEMGHNPQSITVGADPFNSLGTKLGEGLPGSGPSVCVITFPASFSGPVRIRVWVSEAGTSTATQVPRIGEGNPNSGTTGNITELNAATYFPSSNLGSTLGPWYQWDKAHDSTPWTGLIYINVEMASSGTENTIWFQLPHQTSQPYAPRKWVIEIERYNSYERADMPQELDV